MLLRRPRFFSAPELSFQIVAVATVGILEREQAVLVVGSPGLNPGIER